MNEPDLLQQCIAQMMHDDLERRQLDVVLAPCFGWMGDTGRYRRVVQETNPRWYQKFCTDWPSNRSRPRRRRKPDTRIKRQATLRALREIASGHCRTEYAARLLPVVVEETERFAYLSKSNRIEEWLQ